MKAVEIKTGTQTVAANVYESEGGDKVLVIASATGVKQGYYGKFAAFLASNGISTITFDYLGIGDSLNQPVKQLSNNVEDWARKDLESVIEYAIEQFPNHKLNLLGHSIGGQLIGLAPSAPKAHKIILVAAQSGYWKLWKGFGRARLWFNWHVLIPGLTNLFGYLPSKRITNMENLPKNVAKQWARWGRSREYLLGEIDISETYYRNIEVPITAYSIDDDELGTREAVDWITDQYANAKMKAVHLIPKEYGVEKIGHFGIFKEKFQKSLWLEVVDEIT